ncbi:helix-turn-helix domain-containing protein [Embleya sp. AB8]|uniref:helix-turn-helix domain-containing protein n=1 Tax=Embleya sp. AB8 TaxID=3156304 RepID=UPI003C750FCF
MATATETLLRSTIAALMHATGESQTDLGRGVRLSQGQVSRKQAGLSAWLLADLDRVSVHYGVPVPDLLAGPTRALELLPPARRSQTLGGTRAVVTTA